MANTNPRDVARQRRKQRIRKKVTGTSERPRLTVFRSLKHMYAQLIDDDGGVTIASCSTLDTKVCEQGGYHGNTSGASSVGEAIAKAAIESGIEQVVFDRNGYLYHGRVKALADAAREAGLKF